MGPTSRRGDAEPSGPPLRMVTWRGADKLDSHELSLSESSASAACCVVCCCSRDVVLAGEPLYFGMGCRGG